MDLQGAGYFVFLGAVALAHRALRAQLRPALLLIASLIFYAFSGIASLVLLLALCALNHVASLRIADGAAARARIFLFAGVVALDLAILIAFKYAPEHLAAALGAVATPASSSSISRLVVPLGISYFTFQMIAAVTDAYRGEWQPRRNLPHFMLFGLFFPQVTSGPIPRAERLLPQLDEERGASGADAAAGLQLIGYGLFKKFVVANRLSDYVAEIFATPSEALSLHYSTLPTLLGCIFNVLDLYADFSSYVDIARGSARLLGIELDPNFDRPLLSTSITELWRRWHMTLSFWVRDYLFIPLLIRVGDLGNAGVAGALLITFAVVGIWHSATWTFLLFGVSQGLFMSLELLTKRWRTRHLKAYPERALRIAAWAYAMSAFALSQVLFRASSLANAGTVFRRLFSFTWFGSAAEIFAHKGPFDFALDLAAVALWAAVAALFRRDPRVPAPVFCLLCGLLVLALGRLGTGRFIYAGF